MSTTNFKLEWAGRRNYLIVQGTRVVGEMEFKIDSQNQIHVYNVFVTGDSLNLWKFFSQFEKIIAYNVLPRSIAYWRRLGARIENIIEEQFQDIIIEESDYDSI